MPPAPIATSQIITVYFGTREPTTSYNNTFAFDIRIVHGGRAIDDTPLIFWIQHLNRSFKSEHRINWTAGELDCRPI